MKIKHITLSLVSLALGAMAFADDGQNAGSSGSQFLYQTEAGKQAVTPGLSYSDSEIKFTGGASSEIKGPRIAVTYERGLTDIFAVGATLGYEDMSLSSTGNTSTTRSGLQNIDIFGRGLYALHRGGTIKYGIDLWISPGDATTNSSGNSNGFTGGDNVMPFVGWEMNLGPGIIGAKAETQIDLGDRAMNNNGTTEKFSGNDLTKFAAFYEWHMQPGVILGGASYYLSISDGETNGVLTQVNYPFYGVEIYSTIKLGTGELLPRISYQAAPITELHSSDISTDRGFNIGIAYRWTF